MNTASISVFSPETEQSEKFLNLVLERICSEGNAIFQGLQETYDTCPLVLFRSKTNGSTLALPFDNDFSSMRVAIRVRESDLQFAAPVNQPETEHAPSYRLISLIYNDLNPDRQQEWNTIIEKFRQSRGKVRNPEAGFGVLLLEALIVCLIMLVLAAISIPNIARVRLDRQANDARTRVEDFSRLRLAIATCKTSPGCVPADSAVYMLPANDSTITLNQYTYHMNSDGSVYLATPVSSSTHQPTYSFDASGVVTCTIGGSPCQQ